MLFALAPASSSDEGVLLVPPSRMPHPFARRCTVRATVRGPRRNGLKERTFRATPRFVACGRCPLGVSVPGKSAAKSGPTAVLRKR
jgi:hypothetical protein